MKKIFLFLYLSSLSLFATMQTVYITPEFLNKNIKIIDIRTQGEWFQTGILKDSIPITFFDERGRYDIRAFLSSLAKYVKKGEQFALVCATGSRTAMLGNFLGQNGFDVINLEGGVEAAKKQGVSLQQYR